MSGLGCNALKSPPELPPAEQLRILVGPVAHAWRDLARSESDPGAAAVQYRALATGLSELSLDRQEDQAWRDLLVVAAQRDAAWGEALSQGLAVPASTFGPVSAIRSVHLGPKQKGEVTTRAHVLLGDPPWKNWNAELTPWLETAGMVLDATPPFDVDPHWGPWLPREANRQVAGMAYADQGKGPPRSFVARMQRISGPSELRGVAGCDLYQDIAGEGGPPGEVGHGETQAQRAEDLLGALREQDRTRALEAVPALVASRDPRCPGAAFFEAGLTGRVLLAEGDPAARARLAQAVEEGKSLLSTLSR